MKAGIATLTLALSVVGCAAREPFAILDGDKGYAVPLAAVGAPLKVEETDSETWTSPGKAFADLGGVAYHVAATKDDSLRDGLLLVFRTKRIRDDDFDGLDRLRELLLSRRTPLYMISPDSRPGWQERAHVIVGPELSPEHRD
jgi:hypothetical protein